MTGYHCEGCGRNRDDVIPVQRASGCRLWLCQSCRRFTTISLGTKPADAEPQREAVTIEPQVER